MTSSAGFDLSDVSVLCVDKDPVIRTMVRTALYEYGCRDIGQAKNGEEALDLCVGRGFDLIICDLHIRPMDGRGFIRALAQRGLSAGRPVLMLCAEGDYAAAGDVPGVTAWLAKPISTMQLLAEVGAALGLADPVDDATGPGPAGDDERSRATMLAHVAALEKGLVVLTRQERGCYATLYTVQRLLFTLSADGAAFGYELVGELARRGADLVQTARANRPAAVSRHAEIVQVLGSIITAIKRVVQNRLHGVGGDMGLQLLQRLDRAIVPLRGRLVLAAGAVAATAG